MLAICARFTKLVTNTTGKSVFHGCTSVLIPFISRSTKENALYSFDTLDEKPRFTTQSIHVDTSCLFELACLCLVLLTIEEHRP